jgi:hypothetical protein
LDQEVKLAQEKSTASSPQQKGDKSQPAGKIVISSVVTHASLLGAIKERNPIIAGRAE